MSGIFGFTYHDPQQSQVADALDGLSYWNQLYGRLASDGRMFGRSGIGCHVEHFTERFPFGGPILAFGGCHAVILFCHIKVFFHAETFRVAPAHIAQSAVIPLTGGFQIILKRQLGILFYAESPGAAECITVLCMIITEFGTAQIIFGSALGIAGKAVIFAFFAIQSRQIECVNAALSR